MLVVGGTGRVSLAYTVPDKVSRDNMGNMGLLVLVVELGAQAARDKLDLRVVL